MQLPPAIGRRVIVVGDSNAGKSTLAARLAAHLGAPHIELDALQWEPGWRTADPEIFRERVRQALAAESWVLDGNYRRQQQDLSWPLADTVVWLDLGLPTLIRRCLARSWRRWRSRELLWGTNQERFWDQLMLWDRDKSLIAFTVSTHNLRRQDYLTAMRDPRWSHLTFVHLRSPGGASRWLAAVLAQPPTAFACPEPARVEE